MVWIIALIGFGMLFILFEIFLIPGSAIVGIIGGILTGVGIYLVYQDYGNTAGTITLLSAIVVFVVLLIGGFKTKSWERYSIKDSLQGKTNVIKPDQIKAGDTGKAISAIKPIGKARINENSFEVQSYSDYIDPGEYVEVTKVQGKTIFVKRHEKQSG